MNLSLDQSDCLSDSASSSISFEICDDDIKKYFPDPLSLIDPDADLEAVSHADSIADAMLILCPNIPGLPCKARGKYRKRKLMDTSEREQLIRCQNLDNSKRTRLRKRVFNCFLTSTLAALESIIPSNSNKLDHKNFVAKSCLKKDHRQSILVRDSYRKHCSEICKRFLLLRWARAPTEQDILDICLPRLVHITPRMSSETIDDNLPVNHGGSQYIEIKGINNIISEIKMFHIYISSVMSLRSWKIDVILNPEDMQFFPEDRSAMFQYQIVFYDEGPFHPTKLCGTSSTGQPMFISKANDTKMLATFNINAFVRFSEGDKSPRIVQFHHKYDVKAYLDKMNSLSTRNHFHNSFSKSSPEETLLLKLYTFQRYAALRFTNERTIRAWNSVCEPDVVHIMPVPCYRNVSPLGRVADGRYECHGLEANMDDSRYRENFLSSLVMHRGGDPTRWVIDIRVNPATVVVNKGGNRIQFYYELITYAQPLSHLETVPDTKVIKATSVAAMTGSSKDSHWVVITQTPVFCEVIYAADGRILVANEDFCQSDMLNVVPTARDVTHVNSGYSMGGQSILVPIWPCIGYSA